MWHASVNFKTSAFIKKGLDWHWWTHKKKYTHTSSWVAGILVFLAGFPWYFNRFLMFLVFFIVFIVFYLFSYHKIHFHLFKIQPENSLWKSRSHRASNDTFPRSSSHLLLLPTQFCSETGLSWLCVLTSSSNKPR